MYEVVSNGITRLAQLVNYYGTIANILLGIMFVVGAIRLRKIGNRWWWFILLSGSAAIVINVNLLTVYELK